MSNAPTGGKTHRRSLTNILQRPRQQFQYALIFFGGGIALLTICNCAFLYLLNQSIASIAKTYAIDPDVIISIRGSILTATYATVIFAGLLGGLLMFVGLLLSHRIFGPMVPVLRAVRALRDGDYTARTQLRHRDEFQDLGAAINELAESLEKAHGSGTQKPRAQAN